MGRVISGARRVPAEALAARGEAALVRATADEEAARLLAAARAQADAALAAARARGRAEGFSEAAAVLVEARAERERAARLREQEIAALALAVARRVVGECRALDPDLVARRTADTIRRRFLGPVVVRAAPAEAARLREELARAELGERSVVVREDVELCDGACVLEGDGGQVRLDDEEMLGRIGRAMGGGEEG
ncbi:MAG: hypothetical protein HY905_05940 [Deltaproteobacteria bacterium]|nr:hypothetical protein [Deltaproteobacteria bacterium]